MRRNVLLSLCLIILTVNVYAVDGIKQDIDKTCWFTFPATPHLTDVHGLKNFIYETDSCSYVVQIKPLTNLGIVHDTATLSAFYGGIVKGILRGDRATLIGTKRFEVAGLSGVEMEYIKVDKDHQPVSECTRILLINGKLLAYSFSSPYAKFIALRKFKDAFFNSINFDGIKHLEQFAISAPIDTAIPATPTPVFDSAVSRLPRTAVHTELVKSNTLNFIISFAASIFLLAGILYVLVRWKKKQGK